LNKSLYVSKLYKSADQKCGTESYYYEYLCGKLFVYPFPKTPTSTFGPFFGCIRLLFFIKWWNSFSNWRIVSFLSYGCYLFRIMNPITQFGLNLSQIWASKVKFWALGISLKTLRISFFPTLIQKYEQLSSEISDFDPKYSSSAITSS